MAEEEGLAEMLAAVVAGTSWREHLGGEGWGESAESGPPDAAAAAAARQTLDVHEWREPAASVPPGAAPVSALNVTNELMPPGVGVRVGGVGNDSGQVGGARQAGAVEPGVAVATMAGDMAGDGDSGSQDGTAAKGVGEEQRESVNDVTTLPGAVEATEAAPGGSRAGPKENGRDAAVAPVVSAVVRNKRARRRLARLRARAARRERRELDDDVQFARELTARRSQKPRVEAVGPAPVGRKRRVRRVGAAEAVAQGRAILRTARKERAEAVMQEWVRVGSAREAAVARKAAVRAVREAAMAKGWGGEGAGGGSGGSSEGARSDASTAAEEGEDRGCRTRTSG